MKYVFERQGDLLAAYFDRYPRGKCGSMSFDGDSFYSYNTCIAKKYPEGPLLLIGSGKYSTTTEAHIRELFRYFSPYRACRVPDIMDPHAPANEKYYHDRLLDMVKKFSRANDVVAHYTHIEDSAAGFNARLAWLGLDPLPRWDNIDYWLRNGIDPNHMSKRLAKATLDL